MRFFHFCCLSFILSVTIMLLAGCSSGCSTCDKTRESIPDYMKPEIMVLSLSSNGNYAVSSDLYQHIILWDLKNRTYKIVAKNANVYSAYFIKNTNDFMYQSNEDNTVYIENTEGKVVKQFNPGFATYGEVMSSDLRRYIGADDQFNVYQLYDGKNTQMLVSSCVNGMTGAVYRGPIMSACTDFASSGKLLNLTLSPNDEYLTGSDGNGYLFIWNLLKNTHKKPEQANGETLNQQQTFAAISPDGQYILSGDLKMQLFKCSMSGDCQHFFIVPEQLPNEPKNYQGCASGITSIKFIDQKDFLIFYLGEAGCDFPFAALLNLQSKSTLHQESDYSYYTMDPTYLSLLSSNGPNAPQPLPINNWDNGFLRDQAIDTSPSAHVLVMAQAAKNGILVYHYDPATQTLKQVWAPVVTKHWWNFWGN